MDALKIGSATSLSNEIFTHQTKIDHDSHFIITTVFNSVWLSNNLCSMLCLNKVGRMNLKNGKKTKRRPFRFLHVNAKKRRIRLKKRPTSDGAENSKRWCTSWQTAINFVRHSQLRPKFDRSKLSLRQKSNVIILSVLLKKLMYQWIFSKP